MKRSKKYLDASSKVEKMKKYSKDEAVKLVKDLATAKFDETIELSLNLNLDTKKSDQQLRGATVLPIQQKRPQVSTIYIRYAERCRQANAMDFDDLLVQTWVLFQNHEDIRQKYVEKFQFVLVDEYQDTNYAQQAIVYQLTKERQKVCVVGDDAQSIYSFRGANIDNILNFQSQYQNVRLFKLEQNYRSTQLIVQAANSLIRRNERQIPKNVFSKNEHGERLQLKPAYSDKEEAMIVTQDIKRIRRQDHCSWSDFAILYRTNSQSRSFEEQMRKDKIFNLLLS